MAATRGGACGFYPLEFSQIELYSESAASRIANLYLRPPGLQNRTSPDKWAIFEFTSGSISRRVYVRSPIIKNISFHSY